jgi:hypothetical protein
MTIKRRASGAWVTPTAIKRRSGGAWVNVSSIKRRVSGAWVTVWSAVMSLSASPTAIDASKANGTVYTGTVSMTVIGGIGPFTYAWTWFSGGTGISISSATSATCTLSSGPFTNVIKSGTLRGTATDTGNGNATATVDVPVSINFGGIS